MNCCHIEFSPENSQKRINKALLVFPQGLLMCILGFALYLLGAKRKAVAELTGMPEESVKTMIRRVFRDGFQALRDRRVSETSSLVSASPCQPRTTIQRDNEGWLVEFGSNENTLRIPASHRVQARTVVLSLLNAGAFSLPQSALALGICDVHCRRLARKLMSLDVEDVLIDKHEGQKHDYRVGVEQKAEMIRQLAARAITGHDTSSVVLAGQVNEQTGARASARTIRWHINRLGLSDIRKSLPQLTETLKKNSVELQANACLPAPPSGTGVAGLADDSRDNAGACDLFAAALPTITTTPARRQAIVALADARIDVCTIAVMMHCSTDTVRRWIRRARESGGLHDHARSGRPLVYPREIQLRMMAFYCQTQPLPKCGRWTFRWAAQHLKANSALIGAAPGKSTLHRVLQGCRLKPHQSGYFLHITDPDFFPKMEHLIGLYRDPPQNLIFFDECPGIQVLKRLVPDLQTDVTGKRLEEFEYIRNGTMDVLAFLHHVDGTVCLECRSDHKTDTFLAVFKRHAGRYPQSEQLHYVMDNLSSHRGYPFCRLVAELSGIECPSEQELKTQAKRVEWLGGENKRVAIHFTPYHGSWLNWIEFWFAIMGRKVLGESFGSPDELKAALEAFGNEWNLLLAHPFQWSYDGKGLHEKAVKRFTKMLHRSARKIELRILTKQMMLLTNLLKDYFLEVSKESWEQLFAALCAQSEAIDDIIGHESGPVRKLKAEQAVINLTAALYDCFVQHRK